MHPAKASKEKFAILIVVCIRMQNYNKKDSSTYVQCIACLDSSSPKEQSVIEAIAATRATERNGKIFSPENERQGGGKTATRVFPRCEKHCLWDSAHEPAHNLSSKSRLQSRNCTERWRKSLERNVQLMGKVALAIFFGPNFIGTWWGNHWQHILQCF